jgi:PAS domain S-box-containing protein
MEVNLGMFENLTLNSLSAYQKAVNAAAIVSITDSKGRIIYANDLFCDISKFSRAELIGQNHRIVNSGFHPAEFFRKLWHTIASGKTWHAEIKNKAKDGTYYWVDTTITPIFDNDGNVIRYLSIRSLITERKKLETEREKLISDLMHKNNELMQFNYIVSHNLRAPIANLIGLTALLTEEAEPCAESLKSIVAYVSKSVLSIDGVIKDLTQVLSARTPINEIIEKINIREVIESVEDNLEKQIKESNTSFKIDIADDAMNINSIRSYVQSILYNIISNAIKYRKDDVYPFISIVITKTDNNIILKITDNGIGMDLNKLRPQLFGLYKKFNFDKEGRGLGLHMTKTQVESLGGKIEVESVPGIGTTFTISLPAPGDVQPETAAPGVDERTSSNQ